MHGTPDFEEERLPPDHRSYDKHWMPWLQQQLQARGIPSERPHMPDPWHMDYEAYKQEFEKYSVDEDTVLIGHSSGCAFLTRWLGDTQQPAAKLILVAPWKNASTDDTYRKAFYGFSIDKSISQRVPRICIFSSDNEEEEGKASAAIYQQALNAELIILPQHGHYTLGDMHTEIFPELLKEVIA